MLNKQTTQGRVVAQPELKKTPSGKSVCTFTIASDEDKRREDGTRDTDFIDCVAWGSRAEFACKYLTKGLMVIVEGRPKPRTYKDKNDTTHKVTELRVDAVYFTESKKDAGANNNETASAGIAENAAAAFEGVDDNDLPF